MPDVDMALPTQPDIGNCTVGHETGSGNNFRTKTHGIAIPTATPTFSAMFYPNVTLPTLLDIGRNREPTIGTRNQFWFSGRRFEFPMLGRVGSVIKSGMVDNVGVAVEIASPSVSIAKLFPLPGSWPIFAFPVSADVISKSGMVENVGAAVEIASPSVSVQKLFPLLVSTSGFEADV